MSIRRALLRVCCMTALMLPLACGSELSFSLLGLAQARLGVNDRLRMACSNLGAGRSMPDGIISAIMVEVETYRVRGVPRSEILQAELNTCLGGCQQACDRNPSLCTGDSAIDCLPYCSACMKAIVDQVYSE